MAVAATADLDIRLLQHEAAVVLGADGYVSQSLAVTGDASGGGARLALSEQNTTPRINRCWKVHSIALEAGVSSAQDALIWIYGKGANQEDRELIPGVLRPALGTINGFWYPYAGGHLKNALEKWYVPNPMDSAAVQFGIEMQTANVNTVVYTLRVYLLWSFYKPWR